MQHLGDEGGTGGGRVCPRSRTPLSQDSRIKVHPVTLLVRSEFTAVETGEALQFDGGLAIVDADIGVAA